MTKEEFYDKCKAHDWYFAMSDDSRVYDKGRKERDELIALAKHNPELRGMLTKFAEAYMGNRAQPTRKECGV